MTISISVEFFHLLLKLGVVAICAAALLLVCYGCYRIGADDLIARMEEKQTKE